MVVLEERHDDYLILQVTTVDKYQGQQNDYILLSLVRTKTVGHIRDVRRLVVAMSRARLGMYVFARVGLFRNCVELAHAFNILTQLPLQLHLLPTESFMANRRVHDHLSDDQSFVIKDMSEMVQFVYTFYQKKVEEWKQTKPEMIENILKQQNEKVENEDLVQNEQESEKDKEEVMNVNDHEHDLEVKETEIDEEELGFEKLTEDDDGTQVFEELPPIEDE